MFKSYGPIRATPKDISQTLFSQSNVCMNKRKMTGECRLGSRAIIHPRRVRCRHERRDASRHPLMRSLLRVFSGIFLFSFYPLPCGKPRLQWAAACVWYRYFRGNETARGPGAENSRADKSKGINIRRRNSSLSAADLPVPVKR